MSGDLKDLRKQELFDIILQERFGDLNKDREACIELLDISKKTNDIYGISFAHAYMGDYYIGENNSVDAFGHLMKAKEICEKNRYLDLLSNVCTWIGICYEMQYDRQMSVHYYMDALELAETTGNVERKSVLLTNIATVFERCSNNAMAMDYYVASFNCYEGTDIKPSEISHYAPLLSNIITVACNLGKIDEAIHYLSILESHSDIDNICELYSSKLILAIAHKDMETAYKYAEKYIKEMKKHQTDRFRFFESLLDIAGNMQRINDSTYVRRILDIANEMCDENEYGRRLQLQYVRVEVFEKYGSEEEKNTAYQEFHRLKVINDSVVNNALVEGILTKMKLREVIKENEKINKATEIWKTRAHVDELTQLLNRHSFRSVTDEISAANDVNTLSLMMIDIDYFKQYNDTYGHTRGDEVLRAVAKSITSVSGEDVYNFRYGGDEFVTICKNKTENEVENFIKAFLKILDEEAIPHEGSLCSNKVTLSVGVSIFSKKSDNELIDIAKLMEEADNALYVAKGKGRDNYCYYSKSSKETK